MFLKYQIDLHLQTKMTLELTSLNHFAVTFNQMLSKMKAIPLKFT